MDANYASHTMSAKTVLCGVCHLCMTSGASVAKDASEVLLLDNNFDSKTVEVLIHQQNVKCILGTVVAHVRLQELYSAVVDAAPPFDSMLSSGAAVCITKLLQFQINANYASHTMSAKDLIFCVLFVCH